MLLWKYCYALKVTGTFQAVMKLILVFIWMQVVGISHFKW